MPGGFEQNTETMKLESSEQGKDAPGEVRRSESKGVGGWRGPRVPESIVVVFPWPYGKARVERAVTFWGHADISKESEQDLLKYFLFVCLLRIETSKRGFPGLETRHTGCG